MRDTKKSCGVDPIVVQIVKYGAVGVGLFVMEYSIYLLIVRWWPDGAVPAYLVSRFTAGVAGLVGHARFSFDIAPLSVWNGLRYAISVIVNMALGSLLLFAIVPFLGVVSAKLVSDFTVIAIGYIVVRTFVFGPSRQEAIP